MQYAQNRTKILAKETTDDYGLKFGVVNICYKMISSVIYLFLAMMMITITMTIISSSSSSTTPTMTPVTSPLLAAFINKTHSIVS